MAKVRKSFATCAEAEAFKEGVEYVNDSYCEVLGIEEGDGGFVVVLDDRDYIPDDDPPEPDDDPLGD
jgi:hypothetical protein